MVQRLHEVLHGIVCRILQQHPIQFRGMIPLFELTELGAHEGQFLARMSHHIGEERSLTGELHLIVAGHLIDEGCLAIYYLVMRDRQDKVLRERIEEREGKVIVITGTLERV